MSRLGIAFSGGPTPAQIVDCVVLAESLGYESAWVAEGHGGDQFAVLAGAALRTTRIQLGTAITSIFVRTAPTIAMAAATVDDLSQGRFILGIGSSHKVQVEAEHGVAYGKPLTRTRECLEIIRALLRDGSVQYAGETIRIENFDLWFEPRRRELPIYISALFPKMLALAGAAADGVILTRSTLETGARIRSDLALNGSAPFTVSTLLPTAVADRRRDALDALRPGLAFYAGFFPRYNRLLAEHGFEAEAAAIAAAWARDDRTAAVRAVSDDMIDATSVVGTPDQCVARIEAYRQSGIDLPILSPFARGPGAKAAFEAVIRACAPI